MTTPTDTKGNVTFIEETCSICSGPMNAKYHNIMTLKQTPNGNPDDPEAKTVGRAHEACVLRPRLAQVAQEVLQANAVVGALLVGRGGTAIVLPEDLKRSAQVGHRFEVTENAAGPQAGWTLTLQRLIASDPTPPRAGLSIVKP